MKEVLCHEWISFSSCDDLESLQLVRKTLHKTIVARSNALPLRPIQRVNVECYHEPAIPKFYDKFQIFVEHGDPYDPGMVPDYETSTRDGDFAEAVRRLQHCCIETFWVDICDSPFLQSWMAQEADDFIVVSIDFDPPNATTDYGVLDAIMNRVRPRTIDVSEEYGPPFWDAAAAYTSKYLGLLARGSFLNSLQIAPVNLWRDAFPQPSFILDEPGYANYELRCYHTNVADGIDAFIESFVRDGCANRKLESVCISWIVRPHRPWPFGPSPMPKLLNSSTKTDKPLPEAAMLSWICDAHRVSECEMHSFVNETQWKRMEVCKWSIEHERTNDSRPWTMHVLQCLVKNI